MNQKKKNIFAICDLEVEYAYNFMEYLNQRKNLPFEVQAFTSAEVLCDYAKTQPIEILLISDKAMCEAVKQLKMSRLIVLTEGVHHPELDHYPSIYKYQSSDQVIREVMDCYSAEKAAHEGITVLKKDTYVIGVYSPIGRAQKTSFALTMGQILARERAVLYINLESYAGFEQIFEETYERTLSDLLYFVRQENTNVIHRLNGMVRSIQNLDYMPPALSPMDIQCTASQEWITLFEEIVRNSNYEVLILDLGDGVQELFHILDYCRKVYVPIRTDALSTAKITQFETLLRTWDYENVLEKMQKIKLPFHSTNRTGKGYIEDLVWSELGDYVRQLQRKELL